MDTIDTNYSRVFPRDLFNEAKLLKCMGQLCLLIEDELTPVHMKIGEYAQDGEEGFKIGLIESGELAIDNLTILIKGTPYLFATTYNSKAPYPLYVFHQNCQYLVFDDNGIWDEEFIEFVKTIN